MTFTIIAKKFGKPTQVYYKFFVIHSTFHKAYILDSLGWAKLFNTTRSDFSILHKNYYIFINRKKLSYWCFKGARFGSKSYKLLFESGFFSSFLTWKNKLL